MFGPLGFWEILFILVLALLLFGPRKLPEIGRALGRGLGELRRATDDLKRTFNAEIALEEDDRAPRRRVPPAPPPPGSHPPGSLPQPAVASEGTLPETEPPFEPPPAAAEKPGEGG